MEKNTGADRVGASGAAGQAADDCRAGLSRSTFYGSQRRYAEQGEAELADGKPDASAVWNRLRPQEQTVTVRA